MIKLLWILAIPLVLLKLTGVSVYLYIHSTDLKFRFEMNSFFKRFARPLENIQGQLFLTEIFGLRIWAYNTYSLRRWISRHYSWKCYELDSFSRLIVGWPERVRCWFLGARPQELQFLPKGVSLLTLPVREVRLFHSKQRRQVKKYGAATTLGRIIGFICREQFPFRYRVFVPENEILCLQNRVA